MIRFSFVAVITAIWTCSHGAHAATGESHVLHRTDSFDEQQLIKLPVRVVDDEGNPVVGATVKPWALRTSQGHGPWRKQGYGKSEPVSILTDEQGMAIVQYIKYGILEEQVRTTQVSLSIDHRDFAYVSSLHVDVPRTESEPLKVELERGGSLELQPLIDEKPISLEGVRAVWSDGRCFSASTVGTERANEVLRIPPMPAGGRQVMLVKMHDEKVSHFSEVLDFEVSAGDIVREQVELHTAVRIAGRLSDVVPRPVSNGRVKVRTLSQPYNRTINGKVLWFTWSQIEEDGTFVIDAWPQGESLQLIALCDNYIATSGVAPEEVENPRDPAKDPFNRPQVFRPEELNGPIVVEMTELVSCKFHTVDEGGRAIADVEVSSYPNVGWWNLGSQIYCAPLVRGERLLNVRDYQKSADEVFGTPFSAISDADGRGQLLLPVGKEHLVTRHDAYELPVARGSRNVPVTLVAGQPAEVMLTLQKKGNEYLGEWDKLAGVLFGCTGEECRRLLADRGFRNRMERVRKLYDAADDENDPEMLGSVYEQIAAAFEELQDGDSSVEVNRWRRKAAEQAKKLK